MSAVQLAKAEVVISGQTIPVQFNPLSLQVEITNSINQQGEAGGTNQVSTQSSAKLGLDLLFDTSAAGEDVRSKTRPLRAAVRAPQDAQGGGDSAASDAGAAFVPPLVTFQWGTFTFSGIAESYRETLDFFSADGVPLRAQVAMSLKEQPGEFTALERDNPRGAANPGAFEVPSALGAGIGGAAGVALAGGDLRAARAIAGLNGEASLRFSAGASLSVQGGVQLREAVSFVGGSAGAGVGGGAGCRSAAASASGRRRCHAGLRCRCQCRFRCRARHRHRCLGALAGERTGAALRRAPPGPCTSGAPAGHRCQVPASPSTAAPCRPAPPGCAAMSGRAGRCRRDLKFEL